MIPVNTPRLAGNEAAYLQECIETGWISSEGPFVSRFESAFAKVVDQKFGIAVTNGTAALECAIAALRIGPGDEVILPTFTIISCASAIVRAGATPVLVDLDPTTWNMDVQQIATKITARTKAIMAVHLYSLPADMDPILQLCEQHGLFLIEDAAEVHGQTYKGRPCGSFGHISTFSFYPNKHLTTGEGGMVLTNDEALAERCRSLRNLCFQPQKRFVHEELGWNWRMTNLQAALGLAQLEQLEEVVKLKRQMGDRYRESLKELEAYFEFPPSDKSYSKNIYWVFGLVVKSQSPVSLSSITDALKKHRIGTRPFFWPMHEQPVFKKMGLFQDEKYPVAEHLARNGFYLPSGLGLSETDQNKVADCLKEIMG
ncbi:MAG: DegT/DnrJ/EryC1/StrS family aminotransferase [Salibacteraceae bacterium]